MAKILISSGAKQHKFLRPIIELLKKKGHDIIWSADSLAPPINLEGRLEIVNVVLKFNYHTF